MEPTKLHLRLAVCSYVLAYLFVAWFYAADQIIYGKGKVNGTIHFEAECAPLAKAIFRPGYVPNFKEFVRIQDEFDRCNEQAKKLHEHG